MPSEGTALSSCVFLQWEKGSRLFLSQLVNGVCNKGGDSAFVRDYLQGQMNPHLVLEEYLWQQDGVCVCMCVSVST